MKNDLHLYGTGRISVHGHRRPRLYRNIVKSHVG